MYRIGQRNGYSKSNLNETIRTRSFAGFKVWIKSRLISWYRQCGRCINAGGDTTMSDISVHQSFKNTYVLNYTLNGKQYGIMLKEVKGPQRISRITHDGEDVTDRVLYWMGPERNFHNLEYTPRDIGLGELQIEFIDGETLTIQRTETIVLNV